MKNYSPLQADGGQACASRRRPSAAKGCGERLNSIRAARNASSGRHMWRNVALLGQRIATLRVRFRFVRRP